MFYGDASGPPCASWVYLIKSIECEFSLGPAGMCPRSNMFGLGTLGCVRASRLMLALTRTPYRRRCEVSAWSGAAGDRMDGLAGQSPGRDPSQSRDPETAARGARAASGSGVCRAVAERACVSAHARLGSGELQLRPQLLAHSAL
jgi:hypothetical protein